MENELKGFVLFQSARANDFSVGIIVGNNGMRLTAGAFRQRGSPEYINVFFDENTKRMMIKKADKRMANIYKVNSSKNITSSSVKAYLLHVAELERLNEVIRFDGHNPNVPDTVIFDLNKYQKQK